ncbi:ATP-binding protein [Mesorhizobium onobrychidis]|uniref:ATP-binding protein n=1 Tax=Mesorhizobium onobrychidis TaxID=2775404 RepID=A0ABY5QYH0_9HYPH|nr:DUF87 domain-containing protein [Mesorhizobium onobrychidis]UVC16138.1 ATP-binding protein [Mesorhizobium onobrychidis]
MLETRTENFVIPEARVARIRQCIDMLVSIKLLDEQSEMTNYRLEPEVTRQPGDLVVGDAGQRGRDKLLLGTLAEAGARRRLWLDITGEQVVGIFGKRGTGKSYSLGLLLEGLASGAGSTRLAELATPRGALVLDIMDIFWTSTIPLINDGSAEVRKQFAIMDKAGFQSRALSVDLWIPAGFQNPAIDPPGVRQLYIAAHELELDDWASLFEVDVFAEPRGMLIADMLNYVSRDGYTDVRNGNRIAPDQQFTFADLSAFLENCSEIQGVYQDTTVRSIRQRVGTYGAQALFSGTNTPLTDVIGSFRVSILMLARLPDPLKNVVVSTLLRRLMRERRDASFAQKRLDLAGDLTKEESTRLAEIISTSVPRTWVMMDEAHNLAGTGPNGMARDTFVKYAKEGRNYGLSLAVATQQPSALDPRLTSQIETLIVHQLTSPKDAAVARENIRSPLPSATNVDSQPVSVDDLLRRLDQGTTTFSCANAPALNRLCVVSMRPRTTAHGGYEA